MLFNSVDFFILLGLTVIAYWITQSLNWRQNILLCASLIFYAYWFPPYIFLVGLLAGIAYLGARKASQGKRVFLVITIAALLMVLAGFKYTNFAIGLFNQSLTVLGETGAVSTINLLAPLGISFISFQLIAYIVDVYRQHIPPEKNFRTFLLFICFFPQLIAGPICRANQLIPQIKRKQTFSLNRFASGLLLLLIGLCLKVSFADGLAPFVDNVFAVQQDYQKQPVFWATVGFGVQIFCDFWGYSTMAVGAARLFGIDVPINFHLPYVSHTLREFWRRWHITLSHWFRDYLYIPLGGSRQGQGITIRNLILTMGLCGLWHGANLTFVVWGLLHGVYLAVERLFLKRVQKNDFGIWIPKLVKPFGWLVTMIFLSITWIFFRAASLEQALNLTSVAFSPQQLLNLNALPKSFWLILVAFAILQFPLQGLIASSQSNRISIDRALVLSGWLAVISIVMSAGESVEFIYFDF
ncbi:MAG: MBOAT family protein [Leptolyngbya sp. SIO3F4]|nr:MBOAT family protein [Leptolyngbya sp. SIO3F4]